MKTLLAGLVSCVVIGCVFGCGTPCDDPGSSSLWSGLTEEEIDLAISLLEDARDEGIPKSEFISVLIPSNLFNACPFETACRECADWLVEIVY